MPGWGKRSANFKLNYKEVKTDLVFFLLAYLLALGCVFLPAKVCTVRLLLHYSCLYIYYMRLKFSSDDEEMEPGLLTLTHSSFHRAADIRLLS